MNPRTLLVWMVSSLGTRLLEVIVPRLLIDPLEGGYNW